MYSGQAPTGEFMALAKAAELFGRDQCESSGTGWSVWLRWQWQGHVPGDAAESTTTGLLSVAEADAFIAGAEAQLAKSREALSRTLWVKQNFITIDTDLLASNATDNYNSVGRRST